MRWNAKRIAGLALAVAAAAGAVGGGSSCQQTPANVPLRTFQRPQKVDVVCLSVRDAGGNALPFTPPGGGADAGAAAGTTVQAIARAQCAPVPPNVDGSTLPNHLYALVTQTLRGEVAVVDLTAGAVIDEDQSTPGIDFIPVGANPTDIAVSTDAQTTYVSSADPLKPAIYAIPNRRILGDFSSIGSAGAPAPLRITDLGACALPQAPQALAIVPTTLTGDAGASGPGYVVAAVLAGNSGVSAKVVTIDPGSLASGGALPFCKILGATALSSALPASWTVGAAWPDGVPYADAGDLTATGAPICPGGGVDTGAGLPSSEDGGADASAAADGGGLAVADGGAGVVPDAGAGVASDAGAGAGIDAAVPLSVGPVGDPHPTSVALRDDAPILYVGDGALPLVHVIDLAHPEAPAELPPLLATSLASPTRRVAVGALAISPPTRDYRRYLYAIDADEGSLIVFDVTTARPTATATPMVRPHAELNPLEPRDRIVFSAPVSAVAFVQHDWPAPQASDTIHVGQGLLCNPNPNALPDGKTFVDQGAYYRADQAGVIQSLGTVQGFPYRLRGVFAFATLSNGNMMTIDVDDWDAPCRRPEPMLPTTRTGSLDLPEPAPASSSDLDPYHAPVTSQPVTNPGGVAVTQEAYFPVSAPNRVRSNFLLSDDPVSGQHIPLLLTAPQLFDVTGAPVSSDPSRPILLPTELSPGFVDPSVVTGSANGDAGADAATTLAASLPGLNPPSGAGVRISFDDPTVHQDQDWSVTYEGALPTVGGIAADMCGDVVGSPACVGTPGALPAYHVLTFSAKGANFCARGIEDWSIGRARTAETAAALADAGLPAPAVSPSQWTSDYVEITDDLLPQGDPYWSQNWSAPFDDCWQDTKIDNGDTGRGDKRYAVCQQQFGPQSDADTHLARDFPILSATQDALVLGRFGWGSNDPKAPVVPESTTNRTIVGDDPSNAPFLRLATCCFHRQAQFKVRTGGEWVAVGSVAGLLHHVVTDGSGACVLSCDPSDQLLNARSPDVPWGQAPASCNAPAAGPDRDSPLAMRNPFFSFVTWQGCASTSGFDHTTTARDLAWKFSMRGGLVPLSVSLPAGSGAAVSPQSMRFIDTLGQIAVVDGAQQGLILIDLNTIAFAHNPYY